MLRACTHGGGAGFAFRAWACGPGPEHDRRDGTEWDGRERETCIAGMRMGAGRASGVRAAADTPRAAPRHATRRAAAARVDILPISLLYVRVAFRSSSSSRRSSSRRPVRAAASVTRVFHRQDAGEQLASATVRHPARGRSATFHPRRCPHAPPRASTHHPARHAPCDGCRQAGYMSRRSGGGSHTANATISPGNAAAAASVSCDRADTPRHPRSHPPPHPRSSPRPSFGGLQSLLPVRTQPRERGAV